MSPATGLGSIEGEPVTRQGSHGHLEPSQVQGISDFQEGSWGKDKQFLCKENARDISQGPLEHKCKSPHKGNGILFLDSKETQQQLPG